MADYPRGRLAMGNGDLVDVTDVDFKFANGAKLVHTLRQKAAGVVMGNEEFTCSFNSAISVDGPERDYFDAARRGLQKQLRLKLPGGLTLSAKGKFTEVGGKLPLDSEVTISVSFIGKLD